MARMVQKFGGTSVGSVERIQNVANRVAQTVAAGNQVIVVVSAMGHTTDELIDLARQITPEPQAREMDMLLTTGEQISIALLAMALQQKGISAYSFTGWQAGIVTEPVHSKARIMDIDPRRLIDTVASGSVAIVAGFQGWTIDREITTLGRGGSDTTAVALAAAVQADVCEIYTDVDGVYSTDPRIVPFARKIQEISYDEMLELAHLGAAVLHPRAVEYAKQYHVPLMVRSSFSQVEGTYVKEVAQMEKGLVVRGIAYDTNVAKVGLVGVPNRVENLKIVFQSLAKESINVDIIVQSIVQNDVGDISFTITKDDRKRTMEILEQLKDQIGAQAYVFEEDLAKVSIVGAGMISNPGVAADMFQALIDHNIQIKMVSTSEIKVSCVIESGLAKQAMQILHTAFALDAVQQHEEAAVV
ncbi:aspartate kinase [Fodinisporobacter ferrooxydans]|uniref:Aspartokinase n=1 Tax=Fodinisporobacter ferrooxydans TaxID=2901836 RepID=A0ABY4CI74_9BACL|nr:aspartate kinase [Alicyclobacillaceae bacterium MYW30-H2]